MAADFLSNQRPHTEGQIKRNCCSSQCQVRPGFIRYTISVADDPSITYGDSSNFNYFDFSIAQSSGASCPVSPPMSYDPLLSTETAASYDEFIDNIARYFIEWLGNTFPIGNNTVYRDVDDVVIELSADDYPLEVDNQVDFCTGDYTFLFCQYQFYEPAPSSPTENVCDCPEGFWGGIIEWDTTTLFNIQSMFGTNNADMRPTFLIGGPLTINIPLDDVTPYVFNSGNPVIDAEAFSGAIANSILLDNNLNVRAPLVGSQSYLEDGIWHTKLCLPLDSSSNTLPFEGQNEAAICANGSINQMSVRFEDSGGGLLDIPFQNVDCGCNNCTEGKVCADYTFDFTFWPSNAFSFQGYDMLGFSLFSCYEKLFDTPVALPLVGSGTAGNQQTNALLMLNAIQENSMLDTEVELHIKNVGNQNTWRIQACYGLGNEYELGTDTYWQYHDCCSNNQLEARTAFSAFFDVPFTDKYQQIPGIDPNYNSELERKICCNTNRPTCICPPNSAGNEVTLNLSTIYANLQPSQTLTIDILQFLNCAFFRYATDPSATITLGFSAINNQNEFTTRFINALSQTIHTNPYFDLVNAWFFVEEVQGDDILTIKFCYTPADGLQNCCGRGSGVQFDISYLENANTNEFQGTQLLAENVCCDDDDTPVCGCPEGSYTGEILFTETRFNGEYVSQMLLPPANDPSDMTVNWHRPNGFLGMPNIPFTTHEDSGEQIYLRILQEAFLATYPGWVTISNVENLTNPYNPSSPTYLLTYCSDPGNGQECEDNPELDIFGDGVPAYNWQVRNTWNSFTAPADPSYDGDGQCCTALAPPAGPQNPIFSVIEQELSDCCDSVCRNPKGYISGKFNISESDDTGGRYSVSRIRISINSVDILDLDTLFIYTNAYTPVEAAARFAKYINSNFYDNVFVVPNGPQVLVYVKNVDNVDCEAGVNRTIAYKDNNNTIFFDEETVECCDSEVSTTQIVYTDQELNITPTSISCCPDFNAGIQIVECCSDTPIDGVDLASCIECYSAGRNLDPLNYFQNIQIDVDCIPVDCFAFLFTDANGNTFFTECYEKVRCGRILTICADYPDYFVDCLGNLYGEADEIACECEDASFLKYQFCFNIVADIVFEQVTFEEDDNGRKISRTEYRILSEPVPPEVIKKFENAATSRSLNISENNGTFYEYEVEGTMTRNITGSNMWVIDILVTRKDECVNNFGCIS